MKNFITESSAQTKKLGKMLAEELRGGEIICLSGNLGTGKTTFTQGLLKGLGIKGPYTSPTFAIIKQYKPKAGNQKLEAVYHIDTYRINSKDLLALGWKDLVRKQHSIVIIEWAERIKKLIPANVPWIKFQWVSDKKRKITFIK